VSLSTTLPQLPGHGTRPLLIRPAWCVKGPTLNDSAELGPCNVHEPLASRAIITTYASAIHPYRVLDVPLPMVTKTITNEAETSAQLLPLPNMLVHAEVVLGMDWLSKYAAVIDSKAHTCTVCHKGRFTTLTRKQRATTDKQRIETAHIQPQAAQDTVKLSVAALQELRANPCFLSA
jgi:hypothetical protein